MTRSMYALFAVSLAVLFIVLLGIGIIWGASMSAPSSDQSSLSKELIQTQIKSSLEKASLSESPQEIAKLVDLLYSKEAPTKVLFSTEKDLGMSLIVEYTSDYYRIEFYKRGQKSLSDLYNQFKFILDNETVGGGK